MAAESERLAQVFLWKQGTAPDVNYARQVIRVVNPEAQAAISVDNPPLCLFQVSTPWPADPWARALADMRAIPAPGGTNWADTTRYDLAGWQGTDTRTSDRLFVVTAYRRAVSPQAFRGSETSAPQPQVPYYPYYPTGPIAWPPPQPQGSAYPSSQPVPATPATPPIPQYPAGVYPYAYNPLTTGVLMPTPISESASGPLLTPHILPHESYAPYYVGFGPRLVAGLIDLFVLSLVLSPIVISAVWWDPGAFAVEAIDWLGAYSAYGCLALAAFMVYHIVLWGLWGQTLGKKLAGIKVAGASGERPGLGRAALRMLGYFFSLSLAGWGFLMLALDPRRQALHDKIAETYVVPQKSPAPVPAGLPGYPRTSAVAPANGLDARPEVAPVGTMATQALGMATVANAQPFGVLRAALPVESGPASAPLSTGSLGSPVPLAPPIAPPDAESTGPIGRVIDRSRTSAGLSTADLVTSANLPDLSIPTHIPVGSQGAEASALGADLMTNADKARVLFKLGLTEMERGVGRGLAGYKVEPNMARAAAGAFREALEMVPNSVVYRYFYAVALRYSEGYEVAVREFRQVLELDPSHYETRQQIAYGARWHDAFAYPAWVSPSPVPTGTLLPDSILGLLPVGSQPITRLVLLREGGNKVTAFLSRTPRSAWAAPPTPEMDAQLHLRLSRTPHGPIIALYVIVEDNPENPYVGETFLNPHDPDHPSDDACLMGQHMLEQLARQDRTYLIFADEHNRLLLSRKLNFDSSTQVNIARILYEVQSLPTQIMNAERFREAAQWHMQHFSLDQLK